MKICIFIHRNSSFPLYLQAKYGSNGNEETKENVSRKFCENFEEVTNQRDLTVAFISEQADEYLIEKFIYLDLTRRSTL